MNSFSSVVSQILKESHFNFTDLMLEQFEFYARSLVEWNKKMNLTAITEPREIAIKHFLDSLLILDTYEIPWGANIIDIGTGAGFPGVPLKIIRPDISLTLLDSLNKRLIFLDYLCSSLKINVNLVHERAEIAAKMLSFRENFDVVASRAVAPLNVLLEYCAPFVKVNGFFLALKGKNAFLELEKSQNAQSCLNIEYFCSKKFHLMDEFDRKIIIFRKTAKISSGYPRISSKISKKPL